jgi:hypothetical protein
MKIVMLSIPSLASIAIFLSQFYIFSSGYPQPSHILLVTGFLLIPLERMLEMAKDQFGVSITLNLSLMVLYSILIDLLFYLFTNRTDFIVSSVYWIFSVCCFVFYYRTIFSYQRSVNTLAWAAAAGIILLYILWIAGFGRYNYFPRYNGFFNDPNQMAYWIICNNLIYFVLPKKHRKITIIIIIFVSLSLIVASQSRSGLGAYLFLLMGYSLKFMNIEKLKHLFSYKTIILVLEMTLVFLMIALGWTFNESGIVNDAVIRYRDTNYTYQYDNRGYNRLTEHPEYLAFGAGQGAHDRFGVFTEIHSTWAGLFFYYGITGLMLILFFIGKIYKNLYLPDKIAFLAIIVYGFSTYGARTPIFWITLGCLAYKARCYKIGSVWPKRLKTYKNSEL